MTTHQEILKEIRKYIEKQDEYKLHKSPNSLPFECKRDTRLLLPDIIVTRDSNITHIIEPETSTGGTTICGKVILAEKAISEMVNKRKQSPNIKPKLIFLYVEDFPDSGLKRIKYRVKEAIPNLEYIQKPIIQRFKFNDWTWF